VAVMIEADDEYAELRGVMIRGRWCTVPSLSGDRSGCRRLDRHSGTPGDAASIDGDSPPRM